MVQNMNGSKLQQGGIKATDGTGRTLDSTGTILPPFSSLYGKSFKVWAIRGLNKGLGGWLPPGAVVLVTGPYTWKFNGELATDKVTAIRTDCKDGGPDFVSVEFLLRNCKEVTA